MNKKFFYLAIISIFLFAKHAYNQEITNDQEILKYKNIFENNIIESIKNYNTTTKIKGKINVECYPFCKVNVLNIDNFDYILKVDTSICFVIIKHNDKCIGITGNPYEIAKLYYAYNKSDDKLFMEQNELLDYSKKFTSSPFYIYFLKLEKYTNKNVCFIKDGKINVIENNTFEMKGLDTFILGKFGSFKKLYELRNYENFKDSLSRSITIEEAKSILNKSYSKYLQYYPSDTLRGLNLLLDEIEDVVSISPSQRGLLKKIITDRINKWDLNNYTGFGISFLNEDISNEIYSVLLNDQFFDFIRKRLNNELIEYIANERIYNYFIQKKKSNESFDDFIKTEIFNTTQNR